MHQAFIPACLALFSVGWLHRKLKIPPESWMLSVETDFVNINTECIKPLSSDVSEFMPSKLDVWARGSEPLLTWVVQEAPSHIWILSLSLSLCILISNSFPHLVFLKCVLWLTSPTRFCEDKNWGEKSNTVYTIPSFCGSLCSQCIKSSEQTCLT